MGTTPTGGDNLENMGLSPITLKCKVPHPRVHHTARTRFTHDMQHLSETYGTYLL